MFKTGSFALLLVASLTGFCLAQQVPVPVGTPQSRTNPAGMARSNPAIGLGEMPGAPNADVQQQEALAANQRTQDEIRRDTDKMLQLTMELKDALQKTDRSVLSLDAVKKAEQIEKLARNVKSKIKSSR